MQGRLGPKLSNKVRGVVGNRTKRFLITQTCGGGDFCMFSSRISRFCTIIQKSHVKNCLLTKNIINIWEAWKHFERTLKLNFFFLNTSLYPSLSAKENGNVIRCFNCILRFKTCVQVDFRSMVFLQIFIGFWLLWIPLKILVSEHRGRVCVAVRKKFVSIILPYVCS